MVQARTYTFDASQLSNSGKNVDISMLEKGGQYPGVYLVDVLVNNERVDTREMAFHLDGSIEGKPLLKTCLTRAQLINYGVKVDDFPGLFSSSEAAGPGKKEANEAKQCAKISAIPQATEEFDFYNQRLLLSIPQVALRPVLTGIAPEELWNDGVPAFLMNYRTNINRDEYHGDYRSENNAIYAQLEPGLNLGAWRLRSLSTWQKQNNQPGKWQNVLLRAERGFNTIKSRMTLGEFYSPSDIFNSVPLRGIMMGSDESMVPSNQSRFAPVVRGIARTQARIEVKQNGYLIYSTTVAPGAFDLADLPLSGSGGDLVVTVFESDGQRQVFTVPYTTPAIALRKGYLKYNVTGGEYRSSSPSVEKAVTGQITVMYGLPWDLTVYGGIQGADHYQAGSLGLGLSMGDYGAVSVDGTTSRAQKLGQESVLGQAWRARYSKTFASTNTGFTLASYQYASREFYLLSEVLDTYRSTDSDSRWNRTNDDRLGKRKSRTSLTISQPLGDLGYLNLSGSRETYWNRTTHRDELTAAWGSTFKGISWSVAWSERDNGAYYENRGKEQLVNLWISIPLDRWLKNGTYATGQMTSGTGQDARYEMGLNGRAFDERLRWDIRERMTPGSSQGNRSNSLMNLTWSDTYGELTGGYSYSSNSRQMNAGLAGSMVIHPQGITFGQPLGQTTALIEAPGAKGVSVSGQPGVKTDFRGYTTYGYLTPYQVNTVSLNPVTMSADAEVLQTDVKVVPTSGAIIPARFTTRTGAKAVMTLTRADGTPVPFGAVVSQVTQSGTNGGSGIVGGDGEVYVIGLAEKGQLQVQWGQQQCHVNYSLPEKKGPGGLYITRDICR